MLQSVDPNSNISSSFNCTKQCFCLRLARLRNRDSRDTFLLANFGNTTTHDSVSLEVCVIGGLADASDFERVEIKS